MIPRSSFLKLSVVYAAILLYRAYLPNVLNDIYKGHLVWHDEFEGDHIDQNKWTVRDGGWSPEWHLPANVTVSDSNLIITAKQEDYNIHYTSGLLYTKASWKYGRFEARIKVPYGKTLWPAFWMMPASMPYEGWNVDPEKANGEIDIMEQWDYCMDTWTAASMHTGEPLHSRANSYKTYDLSEDYHIYALDWQPGLLRWCFDNKLFKTETSWYSSVGYPHPFDDPFFVVLMLNAGTLGDPPEPNPSPCRGDD